MNREIFKTEKVKNKLKTLKEGDVFYLDDKVYYKKSDNKNHRGDNEEPQEVLIINELGKVLCDVLTTDKYKSTYHVAGENVYVLKQLYIQDIYTFSEIKALEYMIENSSFASIKFENIELPSKSVSFERLPKHIEIEFARRMQSHLYQEYLRNH